VRALCTQFNLLTDDFQTRIFPLLKPLCYSRGEAVYTLGEVYCLARKHSTLAMAGPDESL
jgi:hypothetical protein